MTSTTSTRRFRQILALLLGMTLLIAACGDDDGDGDAAPDGDDTTPEEPEGDPVPGGEVTYALEAETNGGFCLPEAQLAISGIQVAHTLYDTLLEPDADGELQPGLAESVEPNDDNTVWTITLREGVTFHDGSELTAEVVKNNLDAYRGAYVDENGEPIRSPQLFAFVFSDVESVEVTGPLTVEVTTARPWTAFDWFLYGDGRVGMMAQAQLDDPENCGTNLIGTGPFVLEEWVTGERLVASKNPDYWRTDDNGEQLPYLDQITYTPIPEVASRMNALESGQVDLAHTSDKEQISERLQALADEGTIDLLQTDAYGEVDYTMLNVSQPPFDNLDARRAVAHGLDRQLILDVRGGGIGSVADGPFAEESLGYVEDTGFPEYDPDQARQLAQAYEDETGEPLTFDLTFVATESNQLTAQEVQTQLADVGIEVGLDPAGDQATTINQALAGEFQAVLWRNHPGGDPDRQYNWWYEGSPVNFGRIADPEINTLLDEGRTTPHGAEREEIYQDLNRRFGEQVYNLWTSTTVWAVGAAPDVENVLGPGPQDGSGPFPGLGTGHDVLGLWRSE